jgi:pimeloyl-ACP methyl ester carboxylesterase
VTTVPADSTTHANVVLVHGMGGTEGTWESVTPLLREHGHGVLAVENPMRSLSGDVVNTVQAIESMDGPVLLVGHSYGGAVITNAGNHAAAVGLVYVAAFAPDEGESVQAIVERYPPAPGSAYMKRGLAGEWMVDCDGEGEYWRDIAGDLTAEQRESVRRENRWTGPDVFTEVSGRPAWRHLPSWYMLAADDRTLRPETQAWMADRMGATVTRVPGSHFATRVHAPNVVELIERAAAAVVAG